MARDVRIGTASLVFSANDSQFVAATRRAANQTRTLERRMRGLRRTFRQSADASRRFARSLVSVRSIVATVAGGGGLGLFIKTAADAGDEVNKFSRFVGISAEQLQLLQRVARGQNIEINTFNTALQRLSRRYADAIGGNALLAEAFANLGVQLTDSQGNARDLNEVFLEVADGISRIPNESERVAAAFKLFDSEGAKLALVLGDGRDALEANIDAQRRFGVVTQEQLDSLTGVAQAHTDLSTVINTQRQILAASIAGPWTDLLTILSNQIPRSMRDFSAILSSTVIPALEYLVTHAEAVSKVFLALAISMTGLGRALVTVTTGLYSAAAALTTAGGAAVAARAGFAALGTLARGFARFFLPLLAILTAVEAALDPQRFLARFRALGAATANFFAALWDQIRIGTVNGVESIFIIVGDAILRIIRSIAAGAVRLYNLIPGVDDIDVTSALSGLDSVISGLGSRYEQLNREVEDSFDRLVDSTVNLGSSLADAVGLRPILDLFKQTQEEAQKTAEAVNAAAQTVATPSSPAMPANTTVITGVGDDAVARFREMQTRQQEEFNNRLERTQQLSSGLQAPFESFFTSLLEGTASAEDAFANLAAEIARTVAQILIIRPIAEGIASGISGFVTGGGGTPATTSTGGPPPGFRASGGPVSAGSPYIVGERGPELFVPGGSGNIVPNGSLGGQQFVQNLNINIDSTDGPGVRRALSEALPVIRETARSDTLDLLNRPGPARRGGRGG